MGIKKLMKSEKEISDKLAKYHEELEIIRRYAIMKDRIEIDVERRAWKEALEWVLSDTKSEGKQE